MRTRIIVVITLTLLLVGSIIYAQRGQRITEDDPRWDCHTMGNKICGPLTYELEPLYVTVHLGHFDAVNMAGVMLSEFETRAQLETYAKDKGFQIIYGSYPQASPEVKPVITCAGITETGAHCKRHVKQKTGDYCWQHKSQKH